MNREILVSAVLRAESRREGAIDIDIVRRALAAQPAPAVIDTSLRGFIDAVAADRREAAQPAPVPADLTMTRDELVAAAESIGMRFPAPVPVPLTGHVYLVQYGTKCLEAFADLSAAVAYAYNIGSHAYVACVAVRTPEYVTHVFGIAAPPEKKP
jgi:hypothetical protein